MTTVKITFNDSSTQCSYVSDPVFTCPEQDSAQSGGFLSRWLSSTPAVKSDVHKVLNQLQAEHDTLVLTGNIGPESIRQVLEFLNRTTHVEKLVLEQLKLPTSSLDQLILELVHSPVAKHSFTYSSNTRSAETSTIDGTALAGNPDKALLLKSIDK